MKQQTNLDKVREFHEAFGLAVDEEPTQELMELRVNLIVEEYEELMEELFFGTGIRNGEDYDQFNTKIKPNWIKEMADLLYVIYGTAVSFGIDLDTAFNRTHMSNMSKIGPKGEVLRRADGKVIKPDHYKPPTMEDLVP